MKQFLLISDLHQGLITGKSLSTNLLTLMMSILEFLRRMSTLQLQQQRLDVSGDGLQLEKRSSNQPKEVDKSINLEAFVR